MLKSVLFSILIGIALCAAKPESADIEYEFLIFPKGCFSKIFKLDSECIGMTISKFFSMLILLGSLVIKIPQILIILKEKSVKGISVNSYIFEMISNSANIVYYMYIGLPVKSYGENFSLLGANFISNIFYFGLIIWVSL